MDDPKYMHAVTSLDEANKYTSCHMDDSSMKQSFSSSIPVGGCHPSDDNSNNSMTVIKSEDGVSHSYVLPSFLH